VTAHPLPSQLATPLPCVGPGQFVPHAVPQLFGSSSRTQALPQRWALALQVKPHVVPPLHVAVAFAGAVHAWHAAPAPQRVASLFAAQLGLAPSLQRWSLLLHVNPHAMAEQEAVPFGTDGHAPQPPQWFGSFVSFTHDEPHRLSPDAQPEVHAKGVAALPVAEQYGVDVGEQAFEQLPQCIGALRSVSHPLSGFEEQMP
jgi:hypothetical protein